MPVFLKLTMRKKFQPKIQYAIYQKCEERLIIFLFNKIVILFNQSETYIKCVSIYNLLVQTERERRLCLVQRNQVMSKIKQVLF